MGHIVDSGPAEPAVSVDVPYAIPGGDSNGIIPNIIGLRTATPSLPKLTSNPPPVTASHLEPGSLIYQVKPIYPRMAVLARVEGTVVLEAVIAKDGSVKALSLIAGNPLLNGAAIDAVRLWRYRPYLLNGNAVEIQTLVTVNFVLAAH